MPTANYDSSLLTRRRGDKFIAKSFLSRIQPPLPNSPAANTTSYGLLDGDYDNSIMNSVRLGQPAEIRNNAILDPALIYPNRIPANQTALPNWIARIIPDSDSAFINNSCILGNYIYIIGKYQGNIILKSASGLTATEPSMTLTAAPTTIPIFIAKYSKDGILQWATKIGDYTNYDNSSCICTDGTNIYITGRAASYTVFYNANGLSTPIQQFTLSGIPGGYLGYIAKYDINGQLLWATKIVSNDNVICNYICSDGNNVYITGYATNNVSLFNGILGNPSSVVMTLLCDSIADVFLIKYNSSGVLQWGTKIASGFFDVGNCVYTDGTNVYVTGFFTLTATLYSANTTQYGAPTAPLMSLIVEGGSGHYDTFIAAYNMNGILQWGTKIGGRGTIDQGLNICSDSTGIYIIGAFQSATAPLSSVLTLYSSNPVQYGTPVPSMTMTPLGTNTSNNDIYIAKYNTSGVLQWGTKIGGTRDDSGYSICSDGSNIYITGQFRGVIANPCKLYSGGLSDPVNPDMSLVSDGVYDALIAKYDGNGQLIWGTKIGSVASDVGYTISTDGSHIYIGGNIGGTSTVTNIYNANGLLAPSLAGTVTTAIANGGDGYLIKMTTDGKFNNL